MNKKNYKLFGLSLTLVFLTSCSLVGEWWYERMDRYIANYFYEYADFDKNQRNEIKRISESYHTWLSDEELPKYRSLLVAIRDLDDDTSINEIRTISYQAEKRFIASNNFFHPHIIKFSKTMTDKQVNQIKQHFEAVVSKRKETESKRNKQENGTLETFVRIFKFLKVELNEEQRNLIIKFSNENNQIYRDPNFDQFDQEKWNAELNLILLDRKEYGFDSRLDKHLKVFNEMDESELNNKINALLAELVSSLNQKQRKNYRQRINFFIKSLDRIIDNYI